MRAAVRCAAPMPSPSRMMMFFAGRPCLVSATTSKLPVAVATWPSLCVALIFSRCTPGLFNEYARNDTTAAFTSLGRLRPVVTTLVVAGAGLSATPSTANSKLASVVPASSRTVACRSKRCPGRKRAIVGGFGLLLANSSLGGVKRETDGAASTTPVSRPSTAANKTSLRTGIGVLHTLQLVHQARERRRHRRLGEQARGLVVEQQTNVRAPPIDLGR